MAAIPVLDLSVIQNASAGAPISGDPAIALATQVNRFLKAAGRPPLALVPGGVTVDLASAALIIRQAQLSAAVAMYPTDPSIQAMLAEVAAAQGAPVAYVQAHLVQLAQQLQVYADSQFGAPWTPFRWALTIAGGLVVVAAGVLAYQRHRALRTDRGV